MTLQGFFSSLITPFVIVPWDLTGLVVYGLFSSLFCLLVTDPNGSWAVDSTFSQGQVVGRRAMGAGPSAWRTCSKGYWFHWVVFGEGQVYVQYMQFTTRLSTGIIPTDPGLCGHPCWQCRVR